MSSGSNKINNSINNNNNITSSNYNATSYGVQGVTTINSFSGPPPVNNFEYRKS